jgi:hypothetical protein
MSARDLSFHKIIFRGFVKPPRAPSERCSRIGQPSRLVEEEEYQHGQWIPLRFCPLRGGPQTSSRLDGDDPLLLSPRGATPHVH